MHIYPLFLIASSKSFLVYNLLMMIYIYLYLYITVALDYIWILFHFTQGGTGVPCPPLCALVAPSFDISGRGLLRLRIPVPDLAVCAGVVEGLGWCGGFDGYWGSMGALTWIGLAWCRLPTAGAERLSYAPAHWNLRCINVWTAPKWWKSYSWRIHMFVSRVAVTLLRGNWISSSG